MTKTSWLEVMRTMTTALPVNIGAVRKYVSGNNHDHLVLFRLEAARLSLHWLFSDDWTITALTQTLSKIAPGSLNDFSLLKMNRRHCGIDNIQASTYCHRLSRDDAVLN